MAVQAQLYAENLAFPLGGSQDLLFMENAGGFNDSSFNLQPQQQQQQMQMPFMQLQNINSNNNMQQQKRNRTKNVFRPENIPSMVFDQSLSPQMKKQRPDIDSLITLHSEKIKMAFEEHRRQQIILLKKYESEAQIILRQKDEEITKARNRTKEMIDFLQRMDTENKAWQRLAKEKEAIIFSLNNSINQLNENACQACNVVAVDDEESCCNILIDSKKMTTTEKRTVVAGHESESEHSTRKMICKFCNNSRNPCTIILLPCSHLCSCKFCEPYIYYCPVCNMAKEGSIEALF